MLKGCLSKQECLFSFLRISVPKCWAAVLKTMHFALSCLPLQPRGVKLVRVGAWRAGHQGVVLCSAVSSRYERGHIAAVQCFLQ